MRPQCVNVEAGVDLYRFIFDRIIELGIVVGIFSFLAGCNILVVLFVLEIVVMMVKVMVVVVTNEILLDFVGFAAN